MQIDAKPVDLKLTEPFRISRYVQYTSPNAIVQITHDDVTGYGEASPAEYYGESVETVLACITLFAGNLGNDPFLLEDIMDNLDHIIGLNPSAKAAVDMALYDIMGKMLGVPVYRLLGLNPAHTAHTSFTIGLDTPMNMAKKALVARDYPILKIKVGTKHDLDIIKAIRDVTAATIRVDANTGWTPKEAIKNISAFAPYNIEFVEQPVPAHDLAGLKLIRDNVPLPIIADESCVTVEDIPRVAESVDGINIKLIKWRTQYPTSAEMALQADADSHRNKKTRMSVKTSVKYPKAAIILAVLSLQSGTVFLLYCFFTCYSNYYG